MVNGPGWAPPALELLRWSARRGEPSPYLPDLPRTPEDDDLAALRTRKIVSLYHLWRDPTHVEQRVYDKIWHAQRHALLAIGTALTSADIPYLIFKGAEHVERWYGGHGIDPMGDCDLLVPRDRIVAAKGVFYGAGYQQGLFDPERGTVVDRDVADIAVLEAQHYELAAFLRLVPIDLTDDELAFAAGHRIPSLHPVRGRPLVLVEMDVHHGVATDIDTAELLERAVPSVFGQGLTLSPSDHLWFSTSRYYTEVSVHGKQSLRDLAYLAPLVASGTVDWPAVLAAAEEYQLHSSLYYFLTFLDHLAGSAVPADVLARLHPSRASRVRDWGWQLGKLFGQVEPFPVEVLKR